MFSKSFCHFLSFLDNMRFSGSLEITGSGKLRCISGQSQVFTPKVIALKKVFFFDFLTVFFPNVLQFLLLKQCLCYSKNSLFPPKITLPNFKRVVPMGTPATPLSEFCAPIFGFYKLSQKLPTQICDLEFNGWNSLLEAPCISG